MQDAVVWIALIACTLVAVAAMARAIQAGQRGGHVRLGKGTSVSSAAMFAASATLLACAIGLGLLRWRSTQPEFAMALPPGWLDLSASAPEENFTALGETIAPRAKEAARHLAAQAMDVAHPAKEGGLAAFSASEQHAEGPITLLELDRVEAEMRAATPAASLRIVTVDKRLEPRGSTTVGVLVVRMARTSAQEITLLTRAYLIAGERHHALLSCHAPVELEERCEDPFEKAVDATLESVR